MVVWWYINNKMPHEQGSIDGPLDVYWKSILQACYALQTKLLKPLFSLEV